VHNFLLYRPDTLYAGETFFQHFDLSWLHYIDVMVFLLVSSMLMALAVNRLVFGNRAILIISREERAFRAAEA
jgi:SSS family solute:Na+ symporter